MTGGRIIRPEGAFPGGSKKRAEAEPERNPRYLAWLRELPCIITSRAPVHAHHVRLRRGPGGGLYGFGQSGKRVPDWQCVPLCPHKHDELHAANEADFWKAHGLDPLCIAGALSGYWRFGGRDPVAAHRAALLLGRVR